MNIHLTGCHHSCAQHYIGDIGLLAARVAVNDDGDTVEGYHILVGGGFGPDATLARDIYRDVKAEDAPRTVERMLQGLSGAPRRRRGNLPRVHAPPRGRRAEERCSSGGGGMTHAAAAADRPIARPRTAPFTPEQRAWLNGFFAGLLARRAGVDRALAGAERRADAGRRQRRSAMPTTATAPWHDQTLPLADRMKLAEGRPLRRRMMAAMAQQDCGQCGYNCEDYSERALFRRRKSG